MNSWFGKIYMRCSNGLLLQAESWMLVGLSVIYIRIITCIFSWISEPVRLFRRPCSFSELVSFTSLFILCLNFLYHKHWCARSLLHAYPKQIWSQIRNLKCQPLYLIIKLIFPAIYSNLIVGIIVDVFNSTEYFRILLLYMRLVSIMTYVFPFCRICPTSQSMS